MREEKGKTKDPDPSVEIKVKLAPKSSRNEVSGKIGDAYRIKVTAPPVDGKANEALVEFLAKRLGVAKGGVQIVSGLSSRLKRVRVTGLSSEEVFARLER